jgi:hypothetical protein
MRATESGSSRAFLFRFRSLTRQRMTRYKSYRSGTERFGRRVQPKGQSPARNAAMKCGSALNTPLSLVNRRLKMRRSLYLTPALAICLLLAPAQQSYAGETAYVYKPDGTLHCDTNPGITLAEMAKVLVRGGIHVYTQRKSYDGREGIAACGNPTGSINVYEIARSDLRKALQMGFQRLDPSWFEPRQVE